MAAADRRRLGAGSPGHPGGCLRWTATLLGSWLAAAGVLLSARGMPATFRTRRVFGRSQTFRRSDLSNNWPRLALHSWPSTAASRPSMWCAARRPPTSSRRWGEEFAGGCVVLAGFGQCSAWKSGGAALRPLMSSWRWDGVLAAFPFAGMLLLLSRWGCSCAVPLQ